MIKKLSKIEYILFSLLCIVSVFAFSNSMTDTYIVPKWCYTILVFVLYLIVISIKSLYNKILNFNVLTMSYIIVVVCTFQALYGISQWLQLVRFDNKYGITGSFDNPAGFAVSLCIGLPFILLCIKSISSRFWIFVMQLLALLFIFTIVISESRSGMIGGDGYYLCRIIQTSSNKDKFQSHYNLLSIYFIIIWQLFFEKRFCRWTIADLELFLENDNRFSYVWTWI